MKKKVKKIPKFNRGTGSVSPYDLTTINNIVAEMNAKAASVQNNGISASTAGTIASGKEWGDMNKTQRTGAIIDAAAALGQGSNVATSGQDVNVGTALSTATSMGAAGATIGGQVGAGVGAGVGLILGTAGRSAGYDANSTSTNFNDIYQPGKGWLSWFDDDDKAKRATNRVQSSNIAKARTEDLKADYANQGINPVPNVLAAEGAIIDNSTQVLVSPGELIYDYKNKTLTKVPFGNGKPNTDDNVFMKVEQGDKKAVINNKADMGTTVDGKTLAMQLEPMIDKPNKKFSKGTIDARDAIIKKALRIQEQHKTGPQEYAEFNTDVISIDKALNNAKEKGKTTLSATVDGKDYVKLGDGFWYTTRDGKADKRVILSKKLRKAFSDVEKETTEKNANLTEGYNQNWESMSPIMQQSFAKALFGQNKKYGLFTPNKMVERAGYSYGPSHNDYSVKFDIPDFKIMDIPSDYGISSKTVKTTPSNTTSNSKYVQPVISEEEKNANMKAAQNTEDIGERHWLRGKIEEPTISFANLATVTPGYSKPLQTPPQGEQNTPGGSNWRDGFYRMAVLSQPWWDMAKAEPVNYTLPNAKYITVGADPTPLMKSADETYGIGNYNFAQFGGSTGQRMGYGAALANNRAKQYADAYKWQQDVQNKQIAQNVGIYNNWDTQRTEILNNVFDKTAANRATARNINRQNRAAALSNYGQMRIDDKKSYIDTYDKKLKTKLLEPFIKSVYENSDELMPVLTQYGFGKNIKKKQNNR